MTKPIRVQLSRAAGFSLQSHSRAINGLPAVKCDRSTQFGNPYRIGAPVDRKQARRWGWNISPAGLKVECTDAAHAVRCFTHALQWDEAIHDYVREKLGGHNLACSCDLAAPCHCTPPLLFVANQPKGVLSEINRIADDLLIRASVALLVETRR